MNDKSYLRNYNLKMYNAKMLIINRKKLFVTLVGSTYFSVGSNFRMTQQSSNIKFIGLQRDRVLNELGSVDKELKDYFKNYLHEEYKGDKTKKLDYVDIGIIARFIVDKLQTGQTKIFQSFFDTVEMILNSCDTYVDNLIVVGLFESIQNTCGTSVDYHYVFNPWLGQLSKTKWDKLIDNWEGEEWRDKYKNVSQTGLG